ncbi:hypothetical protein EDD16DRAFT_1563105 [Pisolithus croceorrhizus]|nr:hypothetical protein EDD16DRAFT_1563105 [Pisolithus croceorrhizus]
MGIPGGFGCTLIAGLISAMLYGITTLQGPVYFMMHCFGDTAFVKFLVVATCILDTLHVSFMCFRVETVPQQYWHEPQGIP